MSEDEKKVTPTVEDDDDYGVANTSEIDEQQQERASTFV